MISIIRPKEIPSKLTKEGVAAASKHCDLYNINAKAYMDGGKFDIKNSIYGHATVKSVLKKAQNNKCCFCEKDQVEEYGAVEHYRPKNGFKSNRKDRKLNKPGYYWLAYDWENLFFVCEFCNGTDHKGNLFPLVDEKKRAWSHKDNYKKEVPYLINPALENPRTHIYFEGQFVRSHTEKGRQSIEVCGLDRESLNEARRALIDNIDARLVIIALEKHSDPSEVKKARAFIRKSMDPSSPYSATAIDYLSKIAL